MSLFAPVWRAPRPGPETLTRLGHPLGATPDNPEKPPETPFRGFQGSLPEPSPTLQVPSEAPSAPATPTCINCRGTDFWQGSGAVVCRRCHPPAPGAERAATTFTQTNGVRGGAA